jgi:hypothetical protein
VRCGKPLEADAAAPGRLAGWFHVSSLNPTIWVFHSQGAAPTDPAERLRCPACERRYALAR